MAGRLGVGTKLRREYSTVLGASEMSLLDLTNIYAVIWNDGYSVRPYSITKIILLQIFSVSLNEYTPIETDNNIKNIAIKILFIFSLF